MSSEDNKEIKQKKQKLVLAKDAKQAVLAIIVMFAFVANSIRMIVNYVVEQNKEKQEMEYAKDFNSQINHAYTYHKLTKKNHKN